MADTDIRPLQPHGKIRELFDDVWFVTGTFRFPGMPPMSFSRNMTIVRDEGKLTLINSLRLDDAALGQLEGLGQVSDVIRLAAFHGSDDPFYKQRYDATVWSVNAPYARGLTRNPAPEDIFFEPDRHIDGSTELPLAGASVIEVESATPRDALLLLDRHDGILVSGDCLQNWRHADEFFNLPAKIIMRLMGFFRPYNVGPGWLKSTKPDVEEIRRKLDVSFEHMLPAHGEPVIGGAKVSYAPTLERLKRS